MQAGERVAGRFEILAEAARGGMGTVYRARDRRDHRLVALKVLQAEALASVERFEREAALLAELRHPNIVEYISHGATPDGLRYLVMEWVDGETLADRLAHDGLTTAQIVALAVQLCRSLAALHARGVVHRDIKPSNVMLVDGDATRVKLVDLGIARRADDAHRLTRTGMLIGTAGYVAPELVRGRPSAIDGRADLFALGCVLHECVTGVPAFSGSDPLAVCAKVLLHDPPPLRSFDRSLPVELEAVVAALLARRPDDRPADAAAVECALAAIGELPGTLHRGGHAVDATATKTGDRPQQCGVLIARPDDDRPWAWPDMGGDAIAAGAFADGLAVLVPGTLTAATRLALAIAEATPGARALVATSAASDSWIDRGARALAELEIDSRVSDRPDVGGVWIEREDITELAGAFRLAVVGRHARILGALE